LIKGLFWPRTLEDPAHTAADHRQVSARPPNGQRSPGFHVGSKPPQRRGTAGHRQASRLTHRPVGPRAPNVGGQARSAVIAGPQPPRFISPLGQASQSSKAKWARDGKRRRPDRFRRTGSFGCPAARSGGRAARFPGHSPVLPSGDGSGGEDVLRRQSRLRTSTGPVATVKNRAAGARLRLTMSPRAARRQVKNRHHRLRTTKAKTLAALHDDAQTARPTTKFFPRHAGRPHPGPPMGAGGGTSRPDSRNGSAEPTGETSRGKGALPTRQSTNSQLHLYSPTAPAGSTPPPTTKRPVGRAPGNSYQFPGRRQYLYQIANGQPIRRSAYYPSPSTAARL